MSWNSRQATSRHQHPASAMSQATVWTTATKGKQEKKTGNLAIAGMPATGHPQHQDPVRAGIQATDGIYSATGACNRKDPQHQRKCQQKPMCQQ